MRLFESGGFFSCKSCGLFSNTIRKNSVVLNSFFLVKKSLIQITDKILHPYFYARLFLKKCHQA